MSRVLFSGEDVQLYEIEPETNAADNLAFNTFADASLAIIPATIVWQLNNTTTEKIQLTIVFGLNILTSICSGIKTQYLAELANRTDQTWATYDIFVWVTGELFLMIVCGTIPTLHIVVRWFRSFAGSVRSVVSTQESRKSGSRLPSDPGTDNELAEFSAQTHMSVKTKTTIERGQPVRSESVDRLVEEKSYGEGVRVDVMYDVRSNTRPNSVETAAETGRQMQ